MFKKCKICKKKITGYPYLIKIRKYCSNQCRGKSLEGFRGILEKSGYRHSAGYKKVYSPKHHRTQVDGYMFEHILIAEKKIGRKLRKGENVHHIDHNKKNNNPDNLLVCTVKHHHRLHNGWKKIGEKWYKNCPLCGKLKQINSKNFYKRSNGKFVYHCIPCRKLLP